MQFPVDVEPFEWGRNEMGRLLTNFLFQRYITRMLTHDQHEALSEARGRLDAIRGHL